MEKLPGQLFSVRLREVSVSRGLTVTLFSVDDVESGRPVSRAMDSCEKNFDQ